jgi:fumarate reductase subunit C
MLNITFISGPPASGKTYTARIMQSMFPSHRSKILNIANNGIEFYWKHKDQYDLFIFEEATNQSKIQNFIESIIVSYSNYANDPEGQVIMDEYGNPVLKAITNVIIVSQEKIDGFDFYKNNWNGKNGIKINEIILTKSYQPC